MNNARMRNILLSTCCGALLGGCQIGPGMLPVSNAHYSDAVRVSQSEQLLLNLVRLRYRDLPVFLAVTDISTQFEAGGSASLGGTSGGGAADFVAGTGISYSERPTISFSILGGETFQKRLLAPLQLSSITLLVQSGWRVDRVLRLTLEQLNGLPNARTASGPTPSIAPDYARFLEATSLLEDLRGSDLIDTEYRNEAKGVGRAIPLSQVTADAMVDASKEGEAFERVPGRDNEVQLATDERRLVLRLGARSDHDSRVARLRELLLLEPSTQLFDVVPLEFSTYDPLNPARPMRQLAADTRSLMGVLYYLSNGVEAPPAHVDAGLVTRSVTAQGAPFEWKNLLGDLMTIRSSRSRPRNAAVAVEYRGYWFYVADDDQTTKSTFMLLSQLFALQAGDTSHARPVLTLPVGR